MKLWELLLIPEDHNKYQSRLHIVCVCVCVFLSLSLSLSLSVCVCNSCGYTLNLDICIQVLFLFKMKDGSHLAANCSSNLKLPRCNIILNIKCCVYQRLKVSKMANYKHPEMAS